MARLLGLLLSTIACITAVAGVEVLISERHKLSRRFLDAEGNYNISFYHINDVHAHLDQFNSGGGNCLPDQECLGGYPRIKTLIDDTRELHNDSLWLNVGDEFQGTPFFSHYHGGWKVAEMLNEMNFDAMTLGNHEFDMGDQHLAEFIQNITVPIISANIHSDHPVLNKTIKPYKIFEQYELAVIGVTTDTTPSISSPGPNTTFDDPVKTVQDTVDHIRRTTNIKRIAAITHIGYEEDQRLAKETSGLYFIMGGHSHTLLGNMEGAEGKYPTIVKNKEGEEVFIVTSHRWGEHLGYVDITYDPEGRVLATHGDPIRITSKIAPDPYLQAKVDEWRAPFDEEFKIPIGYANVTLDHTKCKTEECVLGNVITDAMYEKRAAFRKPGERLPDFAFTNGGGVRATIDVGNITRGEVETSFPFSNSLVELDFTGQELWDLFDGVLSRVNKNDTTKKVSSFVQVSSQVQIRWKPFNQTENPNIGTLTSFSISGVPIDLGKTYRVVSIDFLANGGDNIILPRRTADTLDALDETLTDYVKQNSPIYAAIEGRLAPDASKCRTRKRRRGMKEVFMTA
ncbi:Metallo-dependent phosphatase-like protein [Naviculisporaceae sp. PSN 640]